MRPQAETITRRKEWRARVRNALGPHSSDVPTLGAIVIAARALDDLLKLTTDRRYRVAIVRPVRTTVEGRDCAPVVSLDELREALGEWSE